MESKDQNKYFADRDSKDLADIVLSRSQTFYNTMRMNSFLDKIVRSWQAYHGVQDSGNNYGHEISFTGEQGELTSIPVNHYRNLADHIINMITTNRPVLEARAVNTDYKSLAQTYVANSVLDYYMRDKNLESCIKRAVIYAVVLSAGYIKMEWNATSGELHDIDPDTGEIEYDGDVEFTNLSPFDVVVDGTRETWDNDWVVVRTFKNRYNLMAKYPELAEKLKDIPSKTDLNNYRLTLFSNDETDDIPVYEFYHKKSEALPEGRYMQFCSSDCIMIDTKMPYPQIPVYRIVPAEILGTPYGYTTMFDILPLQEAISSLFSTILTNQNAFGVQNVWVPPGANINVSEIAGGLNIIESEQPPQALNLTNTPTEIFNFLNIIVQTSETLTGVNSVVRGNPEASLKSGTALALVQSQSLQFMSGLQQSYVKLLEDVGSGLIGLLKLFALTPRNLALIGRNNKPLAQEFSSDAIANINRVIVDVGNPLSKSIAGRVQMAEQMMQMGVITKPEQYIQVMNTGRLDSLYEGDQNELLYIKQENEWLLSGKKPLVAPTDRHRIHINEHKAVLSDTDLRSNPTLAKAAMDHIEEHLNALRNTDPGLLELIGEKPLPPLGPMGVPMNNPPQPSPQQAPKSPGGSPSAPPPQGPPGQDSIQGPDGESVNLPNLPKVDASLLPNPQLQEQSLGNVRQ